MLAARVRRATVDEVRLAELVHVEEPLESRMIDYVKLAPAQADKTTDR